MLIEYKVRPVTRYIVTRYEQEEHRKSPGISTQKGEYENDIVAYEVAYALCREEHAQAGTPPDDERFQYPEHPDFTDAVPA